MVNDSTKQEPNSLQDSGNKQNNNKYKMSKVDIEDVDSGKGQQPDDEEFLKSWVKVNADSPQIQGEQEL